MSVLHQYESFIVLADLRDIDHCLEPHTLSACEYERMNKLRQRADKARFVVAHRLKRYCLGVYMGVEAAELPFATTKWGKPYCTLINAPYFNLSHSGHQVVLALSNKAEVGVDIETRLPKNMDAVARRICTSRQWQTYQALSAPEKYFLLLWSQKEAIGKAIGQGLSVGFSSIECLGAVGAEQVSLLSNLYYVYTYYQCGMSLAYASTSMQQPAFFRAKIVDGRWAILPDPSLSWDNIDEV